MEKAYTPAVGVYHLNIAERDREHLSIWLQQLLKLLYSRWVHKALQNWLTENLTHFCLIPNQSSLRIGQFCFGSVLWMWNKTVSFWYQHSALISWYLHPYEINIVGYIAFFIQAPKREPYTFYPMWTSLTALKAPHSKALLFECRCLDKRAGKKKKKLNSLLEVSDCTVYLNQMLWSLYLLLVLLLIYNDISIFIHSSPPVWPGSC